MIKQNQNPYVALVSAIFEFSEMELGLVADQIEFLGDEIKPALNKVLQCLTPRQERVLRLICGLGVQPMTIAAISRDMHATRERITSVRDKALKEAQKVTVRGVLAQELLELGVHSPALSEVVEELARLEEVPGMDLSRVRLFGRDHSIRCSTDEPCPTCRVRVLLDEHGVLGEFDELFYEWLRPHAEQVVRIETCGFTPRTTNSLSRAGIVTLQQLFTKNEAGLMRLPNFGRKSLNEIKEFCNERGWNWPSD